MLDDVDGTRIRSGGRFTTSGNGALSAVTRALPKPDRALPFATRGRVIRYQGDRREILGMLALPGTPNRAFLERLLSLAKLARVQERWLEESPSRKTIAYHGWGTSYWKPAAANFQSGARPRSVITSPDAKYAVCAAIWKPAAPGGLTRTPNTTVRATNGDRTGTAAPMAQSRTLLRERLSAHWRRASARGRLASAGSVGARRRGALLIALSALFGGLAQPTAIRLTTSRTQRRMDPGSVSPLTLSGLRRPERDEPGPVVSASAQQVFPPLWNPQPSVRVPTKWTT
mgnify:CR=1 FL=1